MDPESWEYTTEYYSNTPYGEKSMGFVEALRHVLGQRNEPRQREKSPGETKGLGEEKRKERLERYGAETC